MCGRPDCFSILQQPIMGSLRAFVDEQTAYSTSILTKLYIYTWTRVPITWNSWLSFRGFPYTTEKSLLQFVWIPFPRFSNIISSFVPVAIDIFAIYLHLQADIQRSRLENKNFKNILVKVVYTDAQDKANRTIFPIPSPIVFKKKCLGKIIYVIRFLKFIFLLY